MQQVKDELLKTGVWNYMMFVMGINIDLRVSDFPGLVTVTCSMI